MWFLPSDNRRVYGDKEYQRLFVQPKGMGTQSECTDPISIATANDFSEPSDVSNSLLTLDLRNTQTRGDTVFTAWKIVGWLRQQ